MGKITIDQQFNGPWDVVETRKQEIESGPYGTLERVFKEEVGRNFIPVAEAALLVDCHESTARKWLRRCDARFIADGLSHRYYRLDVEEAKAERAGRKTARKSAA
jgi:hypothetical protein